MKQIERAVVFGDLHIPFQDKKAVWLLLEFVGYFNPGIVFINGDLLDCWEISTFTKPPSIKEHLIDELEEARKFLINLREKSPKSRIVYIFGNHEWRFEKFIANNARELFGLEGLTLEEQLHCKELEIEVVNSHLKENYFRYGHLLIGHFNKVNKHSAYTAKNLLDEKGMSLIQNHTHRGGSSYKTDYQETKGAWENFCLCDLHPPYLAIPNWQLGFSAIHTVNKTRRFTVTQCVIIEYEILFGNKRIRRKP